VNLPMLPRWTCQLCGTDNSVAAAECVMCYTPSTLPDLAASFRHCTETFLHLATDVLASMSAACARLDRALAKREPQPVVDGPSSTARQPLVSPLTVHASAAMMHELMMTMTCVSHLVTIGTCVLLAAAVCSPHPPSVVSAPWRSVVTNAVGHWTHRLLCCCM